MILIAGGTGRLGTLVVRRLLDRGLDVRVLTRRAERAAHLGPDVEVTVGDVRDSASVRRAVVGCDVVVSAVHGFVGPRGISPSSIDRDANALLTDQAQSVGAELVLMSGVGAAADHPIELFRMKWAAEQYAIASEVSATIVRPTAFMELWIEILRRSATRSQRPLVFGRGENPINFVSVADVATLVDIAVTDRTTRGQILEIGGPSDLTFNQLAEAVQSADDRSGAPRHVPPLMLRLMSATVGRLKPELGRQAQAALVMDHDDFSFDSSAIRLRFSQLHSTSVGDALTAETFQSSHSVDHPEST
ncbi:MAG: putative nucleoside-diphosphate-sugar epimerase [Ilumatobacteraceae bacterium]|nr:putative nucleoside-diphosphate-sugar epimerase [Ilumatobacteraceae bacterium]